MFDRLKQQCKASIEIDSDDLCIIDEYFVERRIQKYTSILDSGSTCNFVAFVAEGCFRLYHTENGEEQTCHIALEDGWITDFKSFTDDVPCLLNIQALEDSVAYVITKKRLNELYSKYPAFQSFGRIVIGSITNTATDMVISLSSRTPEQRYDRLVQNSPQIIQRAPQRFIASMIGVQPESLSRIKRRKQQRLRS